MNPQRLLDTFIELVKIDSPSRKEAVIAAHLKGQFEALGFTIAFDDSAEATGSDTGNLIAKLPGTAAGHIALSAHMDCVEPCCGIQPVIKGGIIQAQSETVLGADDKAGIAAILEAVRSVKETGEAYPELWVILTTCEELSLLGAKALPDDLFENNVACFVFDADGAPGTIILGAPYHYTFKAQYTGKATHAGVEPEGGISAIQMAAHAIDAMRLGRIDEHTTANVGLIEGGREVNIVPDSCAVSGECRSLYEDKIEACKEQITEALEQGAARFGGTLTLEWILDYPGILYKESDALVQKLSTIAESIGLSPHLAFSGGGADTNVLATKGAQPITLGIGMTDFHALSEHISVKDLEDNTRFIEAIIREFASEA